MTVRTDVWANLPNDPITSTELTKLVYPNTPEYDFQNTRVKVENKLVMLEKDG